MLVFPRNDSQFPRLVALILAALSFASAFSLSMMAAASRRNIVVVGGGIQGTSVAYHLAERGAKVRILEAKAPASAASGKGGGFSKTIKSVYGSQC